MSSELSLPSRIERQSDRLIPSLLAVALEESAARDASEFQTISVPSVAESLEYLSMLSFDLVVAGPNPASGGLELLAYHLQRNWPSQRWLIVAGGLGSEDERRLRQLGGLGVFQELFSALASAMPFEGADLPLRPRATTHPP